MPVNQKIELAENYWDEMGNGDINNVHTIMFQRALDELGVTEEYIQSSLMQEAVLCGNLSALLVIRRQYLYRAIGAFAITEYLFPRRCHSLLAAWKRLGLSEEGISYHKEHIGVDARHFAGFFKNVISPIIERKPEAGKDIYWGAMARLNSSERYLNKLLSNLSKRTI